MIFPQEINKMETIFAHLKNNLRDYHKNSMLLYRNEKFTSIKSYQNNRTLKAPRIDINYSITRTFGKLLSIIVFHGNGRSHHTFEQFFPYMSHKEVYSHSLLQSLLLATTRILTVDLCRHTSTLILSQSHISDTCF